MPKRAKVELYWVQREQFPNEEPVVNWRLVGANGEVMCHCTQGFRDKTDALRSIDACSHALYNSGLPEDSPVRVKIKGPGKKPK